jgi:hypothetical protein
MTLARAQVVVAHFPFHAARVDSVSAGTDSLLENLIEDGLMQGFLVPRGE